MKEKMICRGDLFYYDFGDNSGSVQSGERPVLATAVPPIFHSCYLKIPQIYR